MTDQEMFLEAIRNEPDDKMLRLVYADWLEERGDPRGEFIRIQVRLTQLPAHHPEARRLAWRQERELDQLVEAWRAELPVIPGVEWGPFEKGFVSTATVRNLDGFRSHADEVFALNPFRLLIIEGRREGDVAGFFERTPALDWLRALVLNPSHQALELSGVECSPHLSRLRHLEINSWRGMPVSGLERILTSGNLPSLRSLALPGCQLGGAGVRVISDSRRLGRLQALDLSGNGIDPPGVRRLAEARHVESLTSLTLNGNRISDAGVRRLTESSWLGRTWRLELAGTGVGDVGAAELAACPLLTGLRIFKLESNHVGDVGALALARSPHLNNLTKFYLYENQIGPAGMRALRDRFGNVVHL